MCYIMHVSFFVVYYLNYCGFEFIDMLSLNVE